MGSGTAAVAAIAKAIKASGVVVRVEPEGFVRIVSRMKEPLVVIAQRRFFPNKYRYLTSYKGLAFFTKSRTALSLPRDAETVEADKIWIPFEW